MPLYRELLLIKITDRKNKEGRQAIECYHQTAYEEKGIWVPKNMKSDSVWVSNLASSEEVKCLFLSQN